MDSIQIVENVFFRRRNYLSYNKFNIFARKTDVLIH